MINAPSTSKVSATQRGHLRRWLRLWQADQALRLALPVNLEAISQTPSPVIASPANLRRPFQNEPPAAVGQIRLLSPSLAPGRPVYVALFRDWESGEVMMAPFSEYTSPATVGEFLTSRRETALKVVSVWNARNVPLSLLSEKSWLVGSLTKQEMANCWNLFRHVTTGAALAKSLEDRVAPPIFVEKDPRIQYQDEESQGLAALDQAILAAGSQGNQDSIDPDQRRTLKFFRIVGTRRRPMALAAAPAAQGGEERTFRIADTGCLLVAFVPADAASPVALRFYDRSEAVTDRFDGARLVGRSGTVLAEVLDGAAWLSQAILAREPSVSLLLPDGRSLNIRTVK